MERTPRRAEQSRAEQSRAEQSRAEQSSSCLLALTRTDTKRWFEPFICKCGLFTKTGSGQTQGKLKKGCVRARWRHGDRGALVQVVHRQGPACHDPRVMSTPASPTPGLKSGSTRSTCRQLRRGARGPWTTPRRYIRMIKRIPFCDAILYSLLKMINIPRQARDKHRERQSKKEPRFFF